MSAEKSPAIVLRTIEFSETSLVVTIFTRDYGKISALAKGARRPKGPFDAALDLLAICNVVFLRKSSASLDLMTEAKLQRRFRAASRNLSALYAGFYLAELLRDMTDEYDPHPDLFQIAHDTLIQLDQQEALENQEIARCVIQFEMAAMRLLGHLPTLVDCASCGDRVEIGRRVAFGMLAGGVLCPQCRHGKRQVASISRGAIEVLRQFASEQDVEKTLNISRPIQGELRGLLNQYICNLLGHRPKTQKLLS